MNWIQTHGFQALLIYWVFAAVSGGMPTPADSSGIAYRWTFSTLSILNASVARFVATQLPASKLGQSLQGTQPVQPVVVADVNPPAAPGK
jgi:hypothetical protein